ERALIYKTMVLTGLRRGEIESLNVGHLHLDGDVPFALLDAAAEKNRQGSKIAIRDDLAVDLRSWLTEELSRLQEPSVLNGHKSPSHLPADRKVFRVPRELVKILNRDLQMAGISKTDERGYTLDVHALRHTFGTHLSRGGVSPRTAQAAM